MHQGPKTSTQNASIPTGVRPLKLIKFQLSISYISSLENFDIMAQQMTMFGKAATASFTAVRPSKAQRTSAVVVRAGAYDEELVQTAVSYFFPFEFLRVKCAK